MLVDIPPQERLVVRSEDSACESTLECFAGVVARVANCPARFGLARSSTLPRLTPSRAAAGVELPAHEQGRDRSYSGSAGRDRADAK